ncbi:helix-turn-helix domain-containing protein [Yokenella regensburgei]|uniref:helix-turn-helix domain-containing protein n=1 Tax=Yokenella regensburgei TaxID=158877 RepID=UPI00289CF2E8|nr:helix-turn-helix transcriptional regulator [Yokenella regensburgei]
MKNSSKIQVQFGAHLKKLRLELGLSQEAFADRCGLDRTYVSGIERGVRNPTLEVINILGTGLGADLKELFDFDK